MSKLFDRLNSENTSLKTKNIPKKGLPKRKTPHPAQSIIENAHGDHLLIPINKLSPDPDQPRKSFDKELLKELSESITARGLLQPILVREVDGSFWIVAGERRFRAAKMAGLEEISAIITTGDPGEISLIENIQRENLSPLELANAIHKMMNAHSYTQKEVGNLLGKSQRTVSNILSILKLPDTILEDLRGAPLNPEIPIRSIVAISQADDEKEAMALYNAAKDGATSEEIREKRRAKTAFDKGQHVDPHVEDDAPIPQTQTITKRPQFEILIGKIEVLIKAFEGIEDTQRFKVKLRNYLKRLETQLSRFT